MPQVEETSLDEDIERQIEERLAKARDSLRKKRLGAKPTIVKEATDLPDGAAIRIELESERFVAALTLVALMSDLNFLVSPKRPLRRISDAAMNRIEELCRLTITEGGIAIYNGNETIASEIEVPALKVLMAPGHEACSFDVSFVQLAMAVQFVGELNPPQSARSKRQQTVAPTKIETLTYYPNRKALAIVGLGPSRFEIAAKPAPVQPHQIPTVLSGTLALQPRNLADALKKACFALDTNRDLRVADLLFVGPGKVMGAGYSSAIRYLDHEIDAPEFRLERKTGKTLSNVLGCRLSAPCKADLGDGFVRFDDGVLRVQVRVSSDQDRSIDYIFDSFTESPCIANLEAHKVIGWTSFFARTSDDRNQVLDVAIFGQREPDLSDPNLGWLQQFVQDDQIAAEIEPQCLIMGASSNRQKGCAVFSASPVTMPAEAKTSHTCSVPAEPFLKALSTLSAGTYPVKFFEKALTVEGENDGAKWTVVVSYLRRRS